MKMPAKTGNKEVITLEDSNTLPDFMHQDANLGCLGMESLSNQDMTIPRIKVMQGLSPEKEQFSFLKNGDFFHSAQEIAIPQPFLAVPIIINKRYILWRPRSMGGGILARANDGVHWQPANTKFNITLTAKEGGPCSPVWETKKTVSESGLDEWGTSNPKDVNSAPAATLMYNVLLAFPANPNIQPAVLTFQRTQVKAAQKLNMKLRNTNRPIFQSIVRFSSFLDHGGGNEFYSVNTELAGFFGTTRKWLLDDKEPWTLGTQQQYEIYKALYEQISKDGLQIKEEDALQETDTDEKVSY